MGDPSLLVDKGCVTLSKDASDLSGDQVVTEMIDASRTAIVDLQIGASVGASTPMQLDPYADGMSSASGRGIRDVVVLLRQATGRDFPKGFRDKLFATLQPPSVNGRRTPPPQLLRFSLPRLSVNATISLL